MYKSSESNSLKPGKRSSTQENRRFFDSINELSRSEPIRLQALLNHLKADLGDTIFAYDD